MIKSIFNHMAHHPIPFVLSAALLMTILFIMSQDKNVANANNIVMNTEPDTSSGTINSTSLVSAPVENSIPVVAVNYAEAPAAPVEPAALAASAQTTVNTAPVVNFERMGGPEDPYLPGSVIPSGARCGSPRNDEKGNSVRDCSARVRGYKLIELVIDAKSKVIHTATFYLVNSTDLQSLVTKWGNPVGTLTVNMTSVIYWQGRRAYLTDTNVHAAARVDFFTFDSAPSRSLQPWQGMAQ